MIYAPVIIPTLNRFEHFKQCLESLANCTWAEYTEVYVGLDYPAKESHWDGYQKIDLYLKECGNLNFKKIHVIKRSHNYGIGINGNFTNLSKEALHCCDRIICTEDDNVFSPNFLVYMNKGLELFKDDKSIIAINGYRHYYNITIGENTFFRQNVDFSAWGFGVWADRFDKYQSIDNGYFKSKLSICSFLKVLKNGNNRAIQFLNFCDKKWIPQITDNVLSVYAVINDYNVIMPSISLVRNMGFDGTGLNCKNLSNTIVMKHTQQMISNDNNFEFIGSGFEFYDENKSIYVRSSYGAQGYFRLLIVILKYFIRNILKKVYK